MKTDNVMEEDCPCKKVKCERHGNCDACRAHHLANKKSAPACDRIAEKKNRRNRRIDE